MGVPLYALISGDIFYLGLGLVMLGVVVGSWRPRLSGAVAWSGVLLALASAVPIHPAAYAFLVLGAVGWRASRARNANRWGVVLLLVVVAGALATALATRRQASSHLPRDRAVFVLGDSISAGLGGMQEGTWPQVLSATLNLRVSNLARAGATLADGVVQAQSIPPGPAVVLVELGGNDLLGGSSPARFGADLQSLLVALVAADRRVLMFELPLLPLQNGFGRIQHETCQRHGVALLPRRLLAGAIALPGNATDGLHLSGQGHSWLAERVSKVWLGR